MYRFPFHVSDNAYSSAVWVLAAGNVFHLRDHGVPRAGHRHAGAPTGDPRARGTGTSASSASGSPGSASPPCSAPLTVTVANGTVGCPLPKDQPDPGARSVPCCRHVRARRGRPATHAGRGRPRGMSGPLGVRGGLGRGRRGSVTMRHHIQANSTANNGHSNDVHPRDRVARRVPASARTIRRQAEADAGRKTGGSAARRGTDAPRRPRSARRAASPAPRARATAPRGRVRRSSASQPPAARRAPARPR